MIKFLLAEIRQHLEGNLYHLPYRLKPYIT